MNTYKILGFSLVVAVLMLSGCMNEHNKPLKKPSTQVNPNMIDQKQIAKAKVEIYSELKKFDRAYYRSILGGATTDEEIADYANVNLLAVKIVCDTHVCKIRLMYDESLLKASVFENFSEPVYSTAYYIARKYKLKNPEVEFYIKDKPFNGN